MVEPIKQESNNIDIEQHAKSLAEFFGAGGDFLKYVVERAKELVRKSFTGNINKRLKDSGMFKVVTDAVGSIFKKPQQQPIVQTTLDKATPQKTNYTDIQPIENANQPSVPFLANPNKPPKPVEKDYIETEEKARIVLIGGLTKEGVDNLKEKLPEIFKEVFKKMPKTETAIPEQKKSFGQGGLLGMLPKGLLAMGGGLTLLLGGLAALVAGLQTDGPFKGLLKIFSRVGIEGGLKMLEKGAKTFLKTLQNFIKSPTKLLQTVYKSLRGVFGKGAARGITKLIKPIAGLFSKLASGIVKMVTPFLKRLPLIGTVISWGFAYTRFKSGDTIGGIIDILSGVANLFPGVGTAISIGLDVLNAFLDYKAGGASPEASQKKAGMIGDFFGGIWEWIKEKALKVFDWFINLGGLIAEAKWGDVFMELAGWVPGLDWILGWFGTDTKQLVQKGNEMGGQYVDMITSFTEWIQTNIIDKITGFVGGVWDKIKSVASYIPFLGGDEEPEFDKAELDKGRKSARGTKPKMADGGVISTDTEALVGEDGDEAIVPLAKGGVVATQPTTTPIDSLNQSAVIPLEKYFNGKDFALSNNTLEKIASNTGNTNSGLQALGQAIIQLARVLELNSSNKSVNNIIGSPSQQQYPSASQVAAGNNDPIRAIRQAFAVSIA